MTVSFKDPMTALGLFRAGHDAQSISEILGITEAKALEQVSSQRSAVLRLRDPYMSHRFPGGDPNYQSRALSNA
ncbi:hypothetical protein G6M50_06220 [Agrobacterium rhizogenes]|nr:hypothetical protein [Rhizobium rhizogenes]NTJ77398.1 hypothetical protein [Rhizobium rhizogenes]